MEVNEDGTTGGSHRVLTQLAVGLRPRGVEVVPVFYEESPYAEALRQQNFSVHVLSELRRYERGVNLNGGRAQRVIKAARAVFSRTALLRRERVHVLHLNNSPFIGYDDWLPAARLAGVKCVVTAATRTSLQGPSILRWLARSHDLFLPVSKYMADSLASESIPRSRMRIVHPGVDIDELLRSVSKSRTEVRAALGVDEGSLLILMVGNLREWKGQHVLLEALALVPPALRGRLRVAFAGDHSERDADYVKRLHRLADATGVRSHVLFLGPRNDVADLLHGADVAVHASVEPEPFGLVVVEAMAMGVPLIASASGGPTEIVGDSSGILVPPGNAQRLAGALEELASHPARRDALASAGRRRAGEYDLSRAIQRHVETYDELLHGELRRRQRGELP